MNNENFKKAIDHIFSESEFGNIFQSVKESDFDLVSKAHDSIHEFTYLAPFLIPQDISLKNKWYHYHLAFITYHSDFYYQSHESFFLALKGIYNGAYTLLRNSFELLLNGAFWNFMAHEEFRNQANKIQNGNIYKEKTLLDWFENILKLKPQIGDELEESSAVIFDKVFPIFKSNGFTAWKLKPSLIVNQLNAWEIFDPISIQDIKNIYHNLSKYVHGLAPDSIDALKRALGGKPFFELEISPEEFNKYAKILHQMVDVGIVIELNVLLKKENFYQKDELREKLRQRLPIIENLGLNFTLYKIKSLIKS